MIIFVAVTFVVMVVVVVLVVVAVLVLAVVAVVTVLLHICLIVVACPNIFDIDVPENVVFVHASEWTQAVPQSIRVKALA